MSHLNLLSTCSSWDSLHHCHLPITSQLLLHRNWPEARIHSVGPNSALTTNTVERRVNLNVTSLCYKIYPDIRNN
jgi:hypothetical protein